MDPQSIFLPARRRIGRKRKGAAVATLPAALTLVAAAYESGTSVTLTFDRPIDIAEILVGEVAVNDATDTGQLYQGTDGAALLSAVSVRVPLESIGAAAGDQLLLTASANTGIVAVTGGDEWAGAAELGLPFP